MPVSALDIASGLFWLLGYDPSDERGRALADRLDLHHVRDQAHLRAALMACAEFRAALDEEAGAPPGPALDLARPRLVFLHIPKCGGTTLSAILRRHFVAARICPARFNTLRAQRLDALAPYSFFTGHFDLESCRALPGEAVKVVTLLRDPHDRLVSLYYFLRTHRPEGNVISAAMVSLARSLPIEAFYRHPAIVRHPAIFNGMVCQLVRPLRAARWESLDSRLDDGDPLARDAAAAGEEAVAALSGLTAFGLVERFDETVALMATALGLSLDTLPAEQVTDEIRTRDHHDFAERPALTAELAGILDELTVGDRVLYAEAARLFERRLGAPAPAGRDPALAIHARPLHVPLHLFETKQARHEGQRVIASSAAGLLAVGPYLAVAHGTYRLTCHFRQDLPADHPGRGFTLDVWHNRALARCAHVHWAARSPAVVDFTLAFDAEDLEFVIDLPADSGFELLALELARRIDDDRPSP